VQLGAAELAALLHGDGLADGVTAPPDWPDRHDREFLESRAARVADDPGWAQWAYALTAETVAGWRVVGHAGFHGPPGTNGRGQVDALEIGYTVFVPYRGSGYATEAVEALVAWGRRVHGITVFLASVSPDNAASRAVLDRTGFAHGGEQHDDIDGLELVYERLLRT
jgi:RimJ/RimL family protein N-acetyltransferase